MSADLLDNRGRGSAGWSWPAIHPEGRKFGLIAGFITLVVALFGLGWLAWPLGFLTVCILAFFRDPDRVVPQSDNLIVAPADGIVSRIISVEPPPELRRADGASEGLGEGPLTRISIFMSVFDVHVNRAPVGGSVVRMAYVPGRFVNAELDKASEDNERQHMLFRRNDGTVIGITQIAGLVARRIVPFVKQGDILAAGQRIGLIRFGSRVDVYLPAGTDSEIVLGQIVTAGETVLARIGTQKAIEGLRQ